MPLTSADRADPRWSEPGRPGARLPPMPWLLLVVCAIGGVAAGVVFGFVRGLQHPPTLVFALFEGGVLVGVPATVLGLALTALWTIGRFVRRHLP